MSLETKHFFFVLGMPRCRTAWLSVLLTGANSFCYHEGAGVYPDFDEYVAALHARPEHFVGDSSPGLAQWVPRLLEEFPHARWIVVSRDPEQSLASFCEAAPSYASDLRAGWPDYLRKWHEAVAKLPCHLTINFDDLQSETICNAIYRYALRAELDHERWHQLRGLRVTAIFPPKKKPELPSVEINAEGFDFTGLRVRPYVPEDHSMLAKWFAHHKGAAMPEVRLPPLGIVVEDFNGPAAALWCYETYGAGVAWIALPVSRPGLTYQRVYTVMAFAIKAIVQLAGKGYEPPASFTSFRVICPPAMGRLLKRLGFVAQPQNRTFYLSL